MRINPGPIVIAGVCAVFAASASAAPPRAPSGHRASAVAGEATFVVFFEPGSHDLGRAARQVIANAAAAAKYGPEATVEVVGYADRTGNTAFNRDLSELRAAVVAAQLARDGLDVGIVKVRGAGAVGKPMPTVADAPGASDRRVEVTVR